MSAYGEWLAYWNGDVSLYVGDTHLAAHYRGLFEDIEPLLPPAPFTLLDYGCGEALMAPTLVARGASVALYDAAEARTTALARTFAGIEGISVVTDLDGLAGSRDLVLVISVLQYVPKPDLPRLLEVLRRTLKPGGRLLIGDLVRPGSHVLRDVTALLGFGLRHGFLLRALGGLARTLRSSYRRERARLGLAGYTPEEICARLEEAGFDPRPLDWNIGHAGHRHSVVAMVRPKETAGGD